MVTQILVKLQSSACHSTTIKSSFWTDPKGDSNTGILELYLKIFPSDNGQVCDSNLLKFLMKTLFLSYLTVRLWCMTLAFVVQSEFPRTTAKMLEHLIVFSITGKLNTQTYAIQLSESCHAYTHCQCVEQTHSGICHKETENPELSE